MLPRYQRNLRSLHPILFGKPNWPFFRKQHDQFHDQQHLLMLKYQNKYLIRRHKSLPIRSNKRYHMRCYNAHNFLSLLQHYHNCYDHVWQRNNHKFFLRPNEHQVRHCLCLRLQILLLSNHYLHQ